MSMLAALPEASPPPVHTAAAAIASVGAAGPACADGAALQTWLNASGLGASGDIAARLRAAAPEIYED